MNRPINDIHIDMSALLREANPLQNEIESLSALLEKAKVIVKTIHIDANIDDNKALVVSIAELFYRKHHLKKQKEIILKYMTSEKVLQHSYNIILSKMETLAKIKSELDEY